MYMYVCVCMYAKRRRERERGIAQEEESYIQNSRDKAELSDLPVAMAGAYERPRKSTSRGEGRGSGRWGTGCNMQI